MSTDEKTPSPGCVAGARPLPDLGGVALSALADLDDPCLNAFVDDVLRRPEEFCRVWTGGGPQNPPMDFGQLPESISELAQPTVGSGGTGG